MVRPDLTLRRHYVVLRFPQSYLLTEILCNVMYSEIHTCINNNFILCACVCVCVGGWGGGGGGGVHGVGGCIVTKDVL